MAPRESWVRKDFSLVLLFLSDFTATLIEQSAGIIEHLEQQQEQIAPSVSPAVAYYYFSFREPITADQDVETTPIKSLLRSVIKQLCDKRPKLPRAVQHLNSDVELRKSNKIDIKTLRSTLLGLAKELGGVYIIIDALDEVGTPVPKGDPLYLGKLSKARSNMIDLLQTLAGCVDIHLLVTSKDDASWDIIDKSLAALAGEAGNHNITVEGDRLDGDIDKMIDDELRKAHVTNLFRYSTSLTLLCSDSAPTFHLPRFFLFGENLVLSHCSGRPIMTLNCWLLSKRRPEVRMQ